MKKMFKFGCLGIVGLIVLIIIIASVANGGGGSKKTTANTSASTTQINSANKDTKSTTTSTTKPKTDSSSAKTNNEKVVGVGDPAKIANVTFTVNKVETKTEIKSNNQFIDPAKASGKFIILHVTIKNEQKKAINIDSSYFNIMTNDGTTYNPSTDGNVIMVIPQDQQLFLEQINPGIQKSGTIVFDVPKNLDLSKAYVQAKTGFWGTQTVKINLK